VIESETAPLWQAACAFWLAVGSGRLPQVMTDSDAAARLSAAPWLPHSPGGRECVGAAWVMPPPRPAAGRGARRHLPHGRRSGCRLRSRDLWSWHAARARSAWER